MGNSVCGIIGVASFEIVITLSLFHRALNESVLVIDLSKEQSITACIPIPAAMSYEDIIEWNGIKVTSKLDEVSKIQEYKWVYINFGMYSNWLYEDLCTEYYLITDSWHYNLLHIKNYKYLQNKISNVLIKKYELESVSEHSYRYQLDINNQVPMYCMEESSMNRYGKEIEDGKLPRKLNIPSDVMEYMIEILVKHYPKLKEKYIRVILKNMYLKKYYIYGASQWLIKKGYDI